MFLTTIYVRPKIDEPAKYEPACSLFYPKQVMSLDNNTDGQCEMWTPKSESDLPCMLYDCNKDRFLEIEIKG